MDAQMRWWQRLQTLFPLAHQAIRISRYKYLSCSKCRRICARKHGPSPAISPTILPCFTLRARHPPNMSERLVVCPQTCYH